MGAIVAFTIGYLTGVAGTRIFRPFPVWGRAGDSKTTLTHTPLPPLALPAALSITHPLTNPLAIYLAHPLAMRMAHVPSALTSRIQGQGAY